MPSSNTRIGSFPGPSGHYQRDLGTVHPPDNVIPRSVGSADLGVDGWGPVSGTDKVLTGGAYERPDGSQYMRDPMTGDPIPMHLGPGYWDVGTGVQGEYRNIQTGEVYRNAAYQGPGYEPSPLSPAGWRKTIGR